ncbi:Z1 domain-containing protein [Pedococcus cremeus]|uniref:Z1 domain-containing protein n=1 Tax=Pedococcus cremeus TaxID=587636 RepID=UPI0015A699E2|nr:Z1 domain-containing protein [Pedococcus cremeus]
MSHGAPQHIWIAEPSSKETWWSRYDAVLADKVGYQSRKVIDADASFIVERCILVNAPPPAVDEERSGERRGVVMGAVQSGKTASMLAVVAKSLDAGLDAIVVLGGTRTALWLQTWERLLDQLDTFTDRHLRRVMLPVSDPNSIVDGAPGPGLYTLTEQQANRALSNHRPIIFVAMKQVSHLERVARTLREVVYPVVERLDRPFHLLVIDDEADDSSIAEADLAAGASLQERQVPRRIVDLWESRKNPGRTAIAQLRATYLAYTATPQANFLQDPSNPLAPTDFVVCLRTPGSHGDDKKREPSFKVHEGVPGWYTGGDAYYKSPLGSIPLCVPIDSVPEEDRLPNAIRGFLVASAVRLARDSGAVGPTKAATHVYGSALEAKAAAGPVMSMLVHPSAALDAHFDTAARILEWSSGLPPGDGTLLIANGRLNLGTAGIVRDMDEHPDRWATWLTNYEQANQVVAAQEGVTPVWPDLDWDHVRVRIVNDLIPATKVAVINSDQRSADRPVFEPSRIEDGWRVAPNQSTIFVSGNVMSRGLTLEGLSTTLFTRSTDDPASDTQMQMQRWFGYRGSYIDVCRVLMPASQLKLFEEYHETDLALRVQVLDAMSEDEPAPPTVLQSRAFKATAKVRGTRGRGLWPGPTPFMTWLNPPLTDIENQHVVRDVFMEPATSVGGLPRTRGLLLHRTLTLTETADLLDQLTYPAVGDGAVDPEADARWKTVERVAGLAPTDPLFPVFRMRLDTEPSSWGVESPSNLAAYLRFWALALERRVMATFSTDEPPQRWSLLDLAVRGDEQPRFRVGLRFGSGDKVVEGPLSELPHSVYGMQRRDDGSRLWSRWGARTDHGGAIWGDEFFDCYPTAVLPNLTPSGARERGSDGLLLFNVIERTGGGVSIAPALNIPVGGPDQVHAVKA